MRTLITVVVVRRTSPIFEGLSWREFATTARRRSVDSVPRAVRISDATANGVSQTMPLPPEPMLLYVTVASASYALLWRWWWRAFDDDGVELSYDEDRFRDGED